MGKLLKLKPAIPRTAQPGRTSLDGLTRLHELGIDPMAELVALLDHPHTGVQERIQILKQLIKYGYPTIKAMDVVTPATRQRLRKLEASKFKERQTVLDFGDAPAVAGEEG